MINWTEIIIVLIGLVFTGILIPLVRKLFQWLDAKTEDTVWNKVVNELREVADNAVAYTQQSFVDALKEKAEDGKLTPEEAKRALGIAMEYVIANSSQEAQDFITNTAVDMEEYIRGIIEKRLIVWK